MGYDKICTVKFFRPSRFPQPASSIQIAVNQYLGLKVAIGFIVILSWADFDKHIESIILVNLPFMV